MTRQLQFKRLFLTKIFLIAEIIILSFTLQIALAEPGKSFTDISTNYWAAKDILTLVNHDIVNGKNKTEFKPADHLKRGELAKLLVTAFAVPITSDTNRPGDVPENYWALPYIKTVIDQGWLNGFPDHTFRPEKAATRAEIAKILVKARGLPLSNPDSSHFSDVSKAHWAFQYIETTVENSLMLGYSDSTFRPDKEITRAEAAAVIYRALLNLDITVNNQTFNGVHYQKIRRFTSAGPLSLHYIYWIRQNQQRLTFALANNKVIGRETLSSMSQKFQAIAGINGDYFSSDGDPSGLMVNGELISAPLSSRSFFGVKPDHTYFISRVSMQARLETAEGKTYAIAHLNQSRDIDRYYGRLFLYTPKYNETTLTNDDGIEVIVKSNQKLIPDQEITGEVREIIDKRGNNPIPSDGFVLSATGSARDFLLANVEKGEIVKIKLDLEPNLPEEASAIGGGPRLITNGEVQIAEEGFSHSLVNKRQPRTAIGYDDNNRLIVLVVDGRTEYFSIGMTLKELADELKQAGATQAINLDGGGSSTIYFNGQIRNYPSDGQERGLANAILIVP
jgi:exopolysaccharide biosynthesis protein